MLRVAYVFERFPSFGQTFCYREIAELARQGAEVSVFSIRRPNGEPTEDWDESIVQRVTYVPPEAELVNEIERASRTGELPEAAVSGLKKWDRQPDFLRLHQAAYIGLRLKHAGIQRVHAHFAGMAARTAYWIRQFFGIDFSLTAHANDIFAPRDFVIDLGKLFDAACAVITVSDFAVAALRKRFPRNAAKFHRVYNGLRLEEYRAAKFDGDDKPLLLSVGRWIEKKGFSDLIDACAILRDRGRAFRCEIIGEGPLEEALRAQIANALLEDFVFLTGSQRQRKIGDRLTSAALFVLACRKDGNGDMDNLPTVIMEAMAAGLPVVSTRLAGIPEMVQPGITGDLVPPNDPGALSDAIESLLANRARSRQYGEHGRELAAVKFSIEKNVAELAAILSAGSN